MALHRSDPSAYPPPLPPPLAPPPPPQALLDGSVGETVRVWVQRGGVDLSLSLCVADLHALSADRAIDVGGCILHPLTYQQATPRNPPDPTRTPLPHSNPPTPLEPP